VLNAPFLGNTPCGVWEATGTAGKRTIQWLVDCFLLVALRSQGLYGFSCLPGKSGVNLRAS
jgi:hypothetical protein